MIINEGVINMAICQQSLSKVFALVDSLVLIYPKRIILTLHEEVLLYMELTQA